VQERSRIPPSPPPFPSWLILFPLRKPRRHVLSIIVPCSCCPHAPFEVSRALLRLSTAVCVSHGPPHQVHSAPFVAPPPPPPLSSCLRRHRIVREVLQIFVLLSKNSNQCWRHCHHKVANLVGLHFFVSSVCHVWAIFPTGERSEGKQRRSS
jgi:hypothetical protein